MKKVLKITLYIIVILLTIIPIIGSLVNMYIDCDSAYYLSMVERILEGYVPYKTLNLGYTPLWFYITAGIKYILQIPNGVYEPFLFIHYLYQIGCAYFIFKLGKEFKIKSIISIFSAFLFILMTHWLNGNAVLLEMPSMFFGLMSCYFVLKYQDKSILNYWWIGFICSGAFLCKQFGFGFLPLVLYLILFVNKDNKLNKSISLFLGYSISIIICFIIWGEDFIPLIFSKYGTTSAEAAGYDISLSAKLMQIISNCLYHIKRINPTICLSFLFIPFFIKENKWKEYLFCLCGFFGFMLQFYFVKGGLHYQLYTIPFSIMIIALLLSLQTKRWQKTCILFFLGITLVLSLYSTYNNRVYKLYIKSNKRQEQLNCSQWLIKQVEEDKKLFIVHGGLFYNYYQTGIMPGNMSTIGYSFGPLGLDEEKCRTQIDSADYILRFTKDYPYESYFTSNLKEKCEQMPTIYYDDEIVLHINNKNNQ